MSLHSSRWWQRAGLIAAFAAATAGCRTELGSRALGDIPGGVEPGSDPGAGHIARLDAACGTGNCHQAAGSGKLPFAQLRLFAEQTAPVHGCLVDHGCYAEALSLDAARTCWQSCLASSEAGLTQSGIFRAAIRQGIVQRVFEAAAAGGEIADQAMPPTPPATERDLAADLDGFAALATWLRQQTSVDFADIRAVRPPADSAGQAVVCDEFHPSVTAQITPGFMLPAPVPFGCPPGWDGNSSHCLENRPLSDFADPGTPGLLVRILRRLEGRPASAYWMRTSPDGRFVSVGNGRIEDLRVDNRSVMVSGGHIDPAFSPDNKFYVWPSMLCPIAPLYNVALDKIGLDVPASGCVQQSVGVYGSLGTDVNGDILLISGYTNNNFGGGTADAVQMPGEEGHFRLRRIANNLIADEDRFIATPFETDYQMAPSGKLVVGRLRRDDGRQVYRVRVMRPDGQTIDPGNTTTSGVICMQGEKANISFDNRFIAFHHYADGSAQDAGATPGHANIFVYDLAKRRGIRVTNMTAGNKAYFPHFRADGWLMFMIKGADGVESIAASNAAFVLAEMK